MSVSLEPRRSTLPEQTAQSKLVSHFSHTEGSMQRVPEAQAPWLWFSKMLPCAHTSPGSASLGWQAWQGLVGWSAESLLQGKDITQEDIFYRMSLGWRG